MKSGAQLIGHRNIQSTTRYTALAPQRFKEFFGTDEKPQRSPLFGLIEPIGL
jgi:hypothetical protein